MTEKSHPSRVCGLKYTEKSRQRRGEKVAPFAGVWIEISSGLPVFSCKRVAPFAGVWIEIITEEGQLIYSFVAPFAGVWIEIMSGMIACFRYTSRTLRGCVD